MCLVENQRYSCQNHGSEGRGNLGRFLLDSIGEINMLLVDLPAASHYQFLAQSIVRCKQALHTALRR